MNNTHAHAKRAHARMYCNNVFGERPRWSLLFRKPLPNEVITFLPSVSRFRDRARNDNFRKVTKLLLY